MALDPAIYEVANQPWSYDLVAGVMKNWGYEPVGDHGHQHQLDREGFLIWSKSNGDGERYFVISCPRWRAHGFSKPVWPAKAITDALVAQEVIHRTGSHDERGSTVEIPMVKKPSDEPAVAAEPLPAGRLAAKPQS